MIRYIVRFDHPVSASARHYYRALVAEAAASGQPVDIVIDDGGVLERAPVARQGVPALARRARARAR